MQNHLQTLGIVRYQLREHKETDSWHILTAQVNNQATNILFISEASERHEDQQGSAFIEHAGKLFNAMLQAIQLNHRPPQKVVSSSLPQQINLLAPSLIVTVGEIAAHHLLQTKNSLDSLRGKTHTHAETNTPLITTLHPAHLLSNPQDKKHAWQDLCYIKKTLNELLAN